MGTGTPLTSRIVSLTSQISVLPSMYLTSTLARKENRLEGQMLQRGLFNWFKWSLCQLVKNQGEVPGGDSPPAFGSVSVETIQGMSEIFILADING